ncbi:DUF4395 domain-containing protein [soil metagenome]
MKNSISITCPISAERVNENSVRVAAIYTIFIAGLALLTNNYLITLLLAADFGIRAFFFGKFSPLRWISSLTAKVFGLKPKPVDAAPKRFAAGVGFAFCVFISVALYFHFPVAAYIGGGILILCAFLEGVFAFCVGCVIYTSILKFTNGKSIISAREL